MLNCEQKNVYKGNPGFVSASAGNYRLSAGSPCIDAGDNTEVLGDTDLDGNARIFNGTVDLGAYEYDGETPEPPSPESSLKDGLVAFWPFDGNAKDASGNGNDGVVNGAMLTADRNGRANGAYYFDGEDDMIVIADSESLRSPTNAISISVWINPDDVSSWVCVLCKGENKRQYGLFWGGKKTYINDYMGENAVDVICYNCPDFPAAKTWQHMVATWDGKTMKVYANGVQVDEEPASGVLAANSSDLFIGQDSPGGTEYYSGFLDDFAIWNRALTAEEVARLYAGEKPMEPMSHRYEIVSWTSGWKAAKADAEARGGHLATITSDREWTNVTNQFGAALQECWLGATDEEEEGI